MKEKTLLSSIGLKPAEAQVYLALLKRGPGSIRQVALAADVNRGTTYEALKQLVILGLVSFNQKGQRRKFVAEDPERIYDLIDARQRELAQLKESAQTVVPSLSVLGERRAGEPLMRFYEDDEGIVAILRDVLNTVSKQEVKEYQVYSSRAIRRYIYRRFPNFTRQRIKLGVFVRVIAVGEGGEPVEVAERKWLPEPSRQQLSSYIIIYANKLALISVSPDDTPYGVVIEEPGVAAMQKLLFEHLWQSLE